MNNIFTYNKIYKAYLDCRENKRNTASALEFEWNLEENLFQLEEELQNKTYQLDRSICFVVTDPSPREIFASTFKDRVVHHILVNKIEKAGEKSFVYDSYACRKGKGTHKAAERLQDFIRKATNNYNKKAYYLQLDVLGFFMNINHNILYTILKKLILKQEKSYQWKKDILWLGKKIIYHNPTKNYIKKSKKQKFDLIPPRKSLFNKKSNKGLPIGNYSSHFFANLYLNQLDHFIKRNLKQKYYLRYVDDFLIIDKNKKYLRSLIKKINKFLKQTLDLDLNYKKTKLKDVKEGIDFLGYITKSNYVLVRKRIINNLKQKLHNFKKIKQTNLKRMQSTVNSYLGHFSHANSYKLRKSIYENSLGKFKKYFEIDSNYSALKLKC